MQVFSDCTVPSNSKEIELESSGQEASASAGENNEVVLVPCGAWKCVSRAISGGVEVSEVLEFSVSITWCLKN